MDHLKSEGTKSASVHAKLTVHISEQPVDFFQLLSCLSRKDTENNVVKAGQGELSQVEEGKGVEIGNICNIVNNNT